MGQDRKARDRRKKKKEDEEFKYSVAAHQETGRKRRKKGEEDRRPVQKSRASKSKERNGDLTPKSRCSKRKKGEDGVPPGSVAADLETGRKRREKEEEDIRPTQKSRASKSKERDGDLTPKSKSSKRKRGEDGLPPGSVAADQATGRKRRKKEEEDRRPVQNSRASKSKERDGNLTPKSRNSKRKRGEDGVSPHSKTADQETGRKRRKKGEEDRRPVQNSRASRSKEKDLTPRSRSSRRKKEEEDKRSAQNSRVSKSKQRDGDLTPRSRSTRRKKEEDGGKSAPKSKRRNKEESNGESIDSRLEQDGLDGFSRLPDLAQDKVLEFLGLRDKVRFAQVCSSWRKAVYRPCHWREVVVKVKKSKAILSSLKKRQSGGVKLTTLSKRLKKLLVEFDTLDYLELSLRDTAILLKGVYHERFESMKVLFLHTRSKGQMQSLIQSLQCFPNLEFLVIKGVVTTCLVEAIADQLKHLDCLCLWNGKQESRLNVQALSHLRKLVHLELVGFQLEGIENLIELSSTLLELFIDRCDLPEGWVVVLSQLSSLFELHIDSNLPAVDSDGLRLLAQSLPWLVHLTCGSSRTSFPLTPELDKLNNEHMSVAAAMSGLQEVGLAHGHMITDAGVLGLCGSLRNLRVLTVTECHQLTTTSIKHISGLSALTELTLESCKDGGNWLKTLAEGSCKLRKLALVEFENSAEGIGHVTQMSSLEHLNIKRTILGATGMAHLNTASFRLESLEILFGEVTVEGLIPLLQRQTALKTLILVEKTGIAKAKVPHLKTLLPHLETCSVFNWNPKQFDWNKLKQKLF